jgi:HEAT repeat protein
MMIDSIENHLAALGGDDDSAREEAIRALADPAYRGEARAIDALVAALRMRSQGAFDYKARRLAAEALGQIGDERALTPLIHALEDETSMVAEAAAGSLARLNQPAAVAGLIAALKSSTPGVRIAVLKALAELGAAHEIPAEPIVRLLADPDDGARQTASGTLIQLGAKTIPALMAALNDPNSTLRGAAADALGSLKAEAARDSLQRVADRDDSKWVRSRAQAALDQLPPLPFVQPRVRRDDASRSDAPPPPPDTLALMRSQQPERVSLNKSAALPDPNTMTVDQVQAMLDQLDVRLANGEISEATYTQLAARWEARLKQLRGE